MTNYPKFLREIELYGRSSITQMEERIIDFPENLEDFFDKNPEVLKKSIFSGERKNDLVMEQVCENNLQFTNTPHTPMKRDGVLFITQRRQVGQNLHKKSFSATTKSRRGSR